MQGSREMSTLNLDENKLNVLLSELENYTWWKNLKSDKDIYIDIRKNNELNAYYNGGSILRINNKYKKIHYSFLPISTSDDNNYVNLDFQNNKLTVPEDCIRVELNDFNENSLNIIKENIKRYYSNISEKGIQGRYCTSLDETEGAIVDSEFAFDDLRIDLVYYHKTSNKLYFVELKTKGDERLEPNNNQGFDEEKQITKSEKERINDQLKKYHEFIKKHKTELKEYYTKLIKIKNKYGLLKHNINIETLSKIDIEEKPIFLIGNANTDFIKDFEDNKLKSSIEFYKDIKEHCCFRIYRGSGSNYINLGKARNIYS